MGVFRRTPKIDYLPDLTETVAVAGTSIRQEAFRGAHGEQPFQLIADRNNTADKNAVAVMLSGRHVGYLPANQAKPFSQLAKSLQKEGTAIWVPGEVREGETGFWVLLHVPSQETIMAWLKN